MNSRSQHEVPIPISEQSKPWQVLTVLVTPSEIWKTRPSLLFDISSEKHRLMPVLVMESGLKKDRKLSEV